MIIVIALTFHIFCIDLNLDRYKASLIINHYVYPSFVYDGVFPLNFCAPKDTVREIYMQHCIEKHFQILDSFVMHTIGIKQIRKDAAHLDLFICNIQQLINVIASASVLPCLCMLCCDLFTF